MNRAYFILCINMLFFFGELCSQYNYWVYDGHSPLNTHSFGSVVGVLQDTTFRTYGYYVDSGTHGYSGVHSIATGQKVDSMISSHITYGYLAGSGDLRLSWHSLPDGGFLTVRAIPTDNSDQPMYIRFDTNLDTLWVNLPSEWEDPYGPSGQNLPIFMLPLWSGEFLSVTFTRVSPSLNFMRFLTHDTETGAILTDHLWNREDVDFDNTISGTGIVGAIQTDVDSVFAWGSYDRDSFPELRFEPFIAKFDFYGNMGNYKLLDLGDAGSAIDIASLATVDADTINFFYTDGILDSEGFNFTPFTAQLKVKRLIKNTLEEFEEITIPWSGLENLWVDVAGVEKVTRTEDDGYLISAGYREDLFYASVYLLKLNENFEVEWERLIRSGVDGFFTSSMLHECMDRSIIFGGGLQTSSNSSYASDYFIKLDACGYMVPSDCPEFVSVADGEIRQEGFRLWPNPGTGAVDAIVPFNARRLQVVDASGRCVYTEDLYYPRQTWQLTHLPNGVYTFIVHTEDGRKHHQRWVKQ
jgi:hypothetical protein